MLKNYTITFMLSTHQEMSHKFIEAHTSIEVHPVKFFGARSYPSSKSAFEPSYPVYRRNKHSKKYVKKSDSPTAQVTASTTTSVDEPITSFCSPPSPTSLPPATSRVSPIPTVSPPSSPDNSQGWSSHPLFSKFYLHSIRKWCPTFEGVVWHTADEWTCCLRETSCNSELAYKYLEIGAWHGGHLISFANTLGKHPSTTFEVVDVYQGDNPQDLDLFERNVKAAGLLTSRLRIHYSPRHLAIFTLPDDHFDFIFVSSHYQPNVLLETMVLAFRKLSHNGVMILDDYGLHALDPTRAVIHHFAVSYTPLITQQFDYNGMYFIVKR